MNDYLTFIRATDHLYDLCLTEVKTGMHDAVAMSDATDEYLDLLDTIAAAGFEIEELSNEYSS